MECVPTASELVEKVAVNGAVADNVPLPMTVAPSRKLTVPVGVPAPGATTATVAVKVILCPKTDGFTDEVRLVVALALLTVTVTVTTWVKLPELPETWQV